LSSYENTLLTLNDEGFTEAVWRKFYNGLVLPAIVLVIKMDKLEQKLYELERKDMIPLYGFGRHAVRNARGPPEDLPSAIIRSVLLAEYNAPYLVGLCLLVDKLF